MIPSGVGSIPIVHPKRLNIISEKEDYARQLGVAQFGRVSHLGCESREFESHHLDQKAYSFSLVILLTLRRLCHSYDEAFSIVKSICRGVRER